jgi:Ca2+-binding RTX toxin-like protein
MAQSIGTVTVLHGQALAAGAEGSRVLAQGDPVYQGETISTGPGSALEIHFLDKTVLSQGSDSKISLDEYAYNPDSGGSLAFKMAQGTFRTVTGQIADKNPEAFQLKSPLATIGIRGTEIGTVITFTDQGVPVEQHAVLVFDGKPVIVFPGSGQAFQVLEGSGQMVPVSVDANGVTQIGDPIPAPPQLVAYLNQFSHDSLLQGAPQTFTPPPPPPGSIPGVDTGHGQQGQGQGEGEGQGDGEGDGEGDVLQELQDQDGNIQQGGQQGEGQGQGGEGNQLQPESPLGLGGQPPDQGGTGDQGGQGGTGGTGSGTGGSSSSGGSGTGGNDTTPAYTPPTPPPTTPPANPQPVVSNTLNLSAITGSYAFVDLAATPQFYELPGLSFSMTMSGIVNVVGTNLAGQGDVIVGSAAANQLSGLAGDDSITGGAGADILIGGAGNDYLDGGDGNDTIYGGTATDASSTGDDCIDGGGGDDAIVMAQGLTGNDWISGGSGDDTLFFTPPGGESTELHVTNVEHIVLGATSADVSLVLGETPLDAGTLFIDGSAITGSFTLDGSYITDPGVSLFVIGGSGNDILIGGAGDDTLKGGAGDDTLVGGAGHDSMDGGTGLNTLSYAGHSSALTIDLAGHTASDQDGNSATLANIANVIGGDEADTITGDAAANLLAGGLGDDSLAGGAGADTLVGGAGGNALDGGDNNIALMQLDVAVYQGEDSISASFDGDFFVTHDGGDKDTLTGIEGILGGDGDDQVNTAGNTGMVFYFDGGAGSDTFYGTEHSLSEQSGWDIMAWQTLGSGQAVVVATDALYSGMGNGGTAIVDGEEKDAFNAEVDEFWGGAGDDTFYGSADRSLTFLGGAGDDLIQGVLNGSTQADYRTSASGVAVSLGTHTDVDGNIVGTAQDGFGGTDTLVNVTDATGSLFGDTITGNAYGNWIQGLKGADVLNGGANPAYDGDWVSYCDDPARGADTIHGGFLGVVVNLATGAATDGWGYADTLSNFENVEGSFYNDTLIGDGQANMFMGLAGSDSINGGNGPDTMSYEDDPDGVTVSLSDGLALDGWGGHDTLTSIENVLGSDFGDTIEGGSGANLIAGNAGADSLNGGGGADTVSYYGDASRGADTLHGGFLGVVVNLSNVQIISGNDTVGAGKALDGSGSTDTLAGFEHADGSEHNDLLVGSGDANSLHGNAGDDAIWGGAGNDYLNGGDGFDTLTYNMDASGVLVNLSTHTATDGSGGSDSVYNFEAVGGSAFGDTLVGDSGNNFFMGLEGADSIVGNGGFDTASYQEDTAGVTVNLVTGAAADGGGDTDTLEGIQAVIGSAFSDNILGSTDHDNLLMGMAGADTLNGNGGEDTVSYLYDPAGVNVNLPDHTALDGWGYTDTISNFTSVIGSAHADTIVGDTGDNLIMGMAGADNLAGGSGDDTVSYADDAAGVNVDLSLGTATDGWGDGDTLSGFEHVQGSGYNDTLTGDTGSNSLFGNAGDDLLSGGEGGDYLDGGDGFNTVSYENDAAGVFVNLAMGTATDGWGNMDYLDAIQGVIGSAYADTIIGSDEANLIMGLAGADSLVGGGGDNTVSYLQDTAGVSVDLSLGTATDGWGDGDTLSGFAHVIGSDHDDTLIGDSQDNSLWGHDGDDLLAGHEGADYLYGGVGEDTVSYAGDPAGVTVRLYVSADQNAETYGLATDGGGCTDTLYGIEHVTGSDYADALYGDSHDNHISGGGGNDTIYGSAGDDIIDGGGGFNLLDYSGHGVAVSVDLDSNSMTSDDGEDEIYNIRSVLGSAHDDYLGGDSQGNWLSGGSGDDTLFGLDGNDTLLGGGGANTLDGGDGNDSLTAGSGGDLLTGGAGSDTITCGAGSDMVSYTSSAQFGDVIKGFDADHDVLSFTGAFSFAHNIFTGEYTGTLYSSATALEASHTAGFAYDGSTLYYSDGSTAVSVATIENHADIQASDIHGEIGP